MNTKPSDPPESKVVLEEVQLPLAVSVTNAVEPTATAELPAGSADAEAETQEEPKTAEVVSPHRAIVPKKALGRIPKPAAKPAATQPPLAATPPATPQATAILEEIAREEVLSQAT